MSSSEFLDRLRSLDLWIYCFESYLWCRHAYPLLALTSVRRLRSVKTKHEGDKLLLLNLEIDIIFYLGVQYNDIQYGEQRRYGTF